MNRPPVRYCVYLIGSPDSHLVKIGTTRDIATRLRNIQNMSPAPLEVLWQTAGGLLMERVLHERFRKYRRHGEWFDFGSQDAVQLVSAAAADVAYLAPARDYVQQAVSEVAVVAQGVPPDSPVTAPPASANTPPGRDHLKFGFKPPIPVSREFLQDDRISALARGVGVYTLAALASSDEKVALESIASANSCTAEQLDAAFDELRDAGYLRLEGGSWLLSDLRRPICGDEGSP